MIHLRSILSILASAGTLAAAGEPAWPALPAKPEGGTILLAPQAASQASAPRPPAARSEPLAGDSVPGGHGWRIETEQVLPNPWNAKLGIPVAGSIRAGDSCLLAFHARATGKRGGTAGGTIQIDGSPGGTYAKALAHEFEVGNHWELLLVPFPAMAAFPEATASASFLLGSRTQQIEIAGVWLWNYGSTVDLAKLPRSPLTYAGRDSDAPWRKQALARIEKLRKDDFRVTVLGSDGKPLPAARLAVRQIRHRFGFGSAVTAKMLCSRSPDGAKYREIVDESFSRVVLENDLKEHGWRAGKVTTPPSRDFRAEWTAAALDWLASRHIETRGHCLTWAVFDATTEPFRHDPAKLRARLFEHLEEVVPAIGPRVVEWDVINHPASWSPSNRIELVLGKDYYLDVMRRAREIGRVPMWLNEDQVFRPGRQQDETFVVAKRLCDAGLTPDGLGIQGHFHCSFLPSPEEMLRVSDRFAALLPALQITEFDIMANGDEALQADWLRDCLIMAFSHPAYRGFQLWGFWEPTVLRKEAMPWKADWSERAHAKVWKTWIGEYWRTKLAGSTTADGSFRFRGYHGRYSIGVELPDRRYFTEVELDRTRRNASIVVE